ncbi:hypothetical protein ACTD5D_15640 [Nocardia takedensis]|uniref:hypothetical protein n=1 Tax=Nocardia takedensis TaxID=259390 RepID=UPI0012F65A17|nr:hypothetical protein [Nocardia takedensis]
MQASWGGRFSGDDAIDQEALSELRSAVIRVMSVSMMFSFSTRRRKFPPSPPVGDTKTVSGFNLPEKRSERFVTDP